MVASLSSGRVHDHVMGGMCRAFWYFSAHRNIKFKFVHRLGVDMVILDALSRKHLSKTDAGKADKIVKKFNLHNVKVDPRHYDFSVFL